MVSSLTGCAGPTTPFGAIHALAKPNKRNFIDMKIASEKSEKEEKLDKNKRMPAEFKPTTPRIYFYPRKQVLHSKTDLTVQIYDPKGIHPDYRAYVFYNGYDVTNSITLQRDDKILKEKNQLLITIPRLRLPSDREHDIQIVYSRTKSSIPILAEYEKPTCSMYSRKIPKLETEFRVPASYVDAIKRVSTEGKINPSFFAGLIAQESSFDPRAVSWAKAIGLTQITSLAEEEIIKNYPHWPRHPKIDALTLPYLKAMIMMGKINEDNEWRLDPETSMKGGISYLKYLDDFWRKPQNMELIKNTYSELEIGLSEVILASYNSGLTRVKSALETRGYDWINDDKLGEAKKYVNRVSSYCYHFAER